MPHTHTLRRPAALTVLVLLLATAVVRAEDWPRWRGPAGNAVSSETSLPLRWSRSENVRWKTAIPGEGSSSPIVWGDRVFLTAALDKGERRLVYCLDRSTGKIAWSRELADKDPERISAVTGHAAATPVTDGQRVIAFFGNAGVVCYDFVGKQLWCRNLGTFETELGLASSPILHDGRVILVCDHDGDRFTSFDSFLTALDAQTGKDVWKTERRGLGRSWSTPILVPAADHKQELIVNAQDHLRGYDPQTGKELWRVPGMTGWVTPSPVFGHGLIFATSGRAGPVLAARPGGRGDMKSIWRHDAVGPYVCSPFLYGDYLYVHSQQGLLTCYEALTGKTCYRERLAGKFTASGVAGDAKVYLTNEAGMTFVIKAGREFAVLARNELDEETVASAAIAGGALFLRTEKHLYCIGGR